MNLNNDFAGTDLLSYNATTGLVVYSVATAVPGQQQVVRTATSAPGWTSIVPMDSNTQYWLTDLLSYNGLTG